MKASKFIEPKMLVSIYNYIYAQAAFGAIFTS